MNVDFGPMINFSIERTKFILLRPFNLKKWIILGFVAYLSGHIASGGNFRPPTELLKQKIKGQMQSQSFDAPPAAFLRKQKAGGLPRIVTLSGALAPSKCQLSAPGFQLASAKIQRNVTVHLAALEPSTSHSIKPTFDFFMNHLWLFIAIFLAVLMGVLVLTWISSIFYFVFIENLIKNTANIRQPFIDNRSLGTSSFIWNLCFGLLWILSIAGMIVGCFISLKNAGLLAQDAKPSFLTVFPVILPYLILLFLLTIAMMLVSWFVRNFVLPIMYKEKIGILKAWGKALELLKGNFKQVLLYLLISIGLGLASALIIMIIGFIVSLISILIIGIIAIALFFVVRLLPGTIQSVFGVIGIALGVTVFAIVSLMISFFFLPIPVFFRLFNLKFIGTVAPQFDLMADLN